MTFSRKVLINAMVGVLIAGLVPLFSISSASASTEPLGECVQPLDTKLADFAGGTGVGTENAAIGDGAVTLPRNGGSAFDDSKVPASWSTRTWTAGGRPTASGGVLRVDGASTGMPALYGKGTTLEFKARFTGGSYQHAGFAKDYTDNTVAAFSTKGGGGLWAVTGSTMTQISSGFMGVDKNYKIQRIGGVVRYSVDNVIVAEHPDGMPSMRAIFSEFTAGGVALFVDNVSVSPYSAGGLYTSRVIDAGKVATWTGANWVEDKPAGTDLAVRMHVGNTPTPDETWSPWTIIDGPGGSFTGEGQYVQYEVAMTTKSGTVEPSLKSITLNRELDPNKCVELLSVGDTLDTDFYKGTMGTTYGTTVEDGEITIKATGGSRFDEALSTNWTNRSWSTKIAGGTVSGGALRVDGGATGMTGGTKTGTVSFDAVFSGDPYEHGGFAVSYEDAKAAAFTTQGGNKLFAYTNGNMTRLSDSLLKTSHNYRITRTNEEVRYYVDDALVATHVNTLNNTNLRPMFSNYDSDKGVLVVDNVLISPYNASGTFTSRIMDAGSSVKWTSANWVTETPENTNVAISIRTGDTATPTTGAWSEWRTIANSGDAIQASSRYIQYKAVLTSTHGLSSPTLKQVFLTWPAPPKATTTTTEAPTTTTTTTEVPEVPTEEPAADVNVVVAPAAVTYGDTKVTLSAELTSKLPVNEGEVTFSVTGGFNPIGEPVTVAVKDGRATVDYTLPGGTDAGNYDIVASYEGTKKFNPAFGFNNLVINKAALSVTADDKARAYGAVSPELTATFGGLVAGDAAADLGQPVFGTDAAFNSPAGTYGIYVGGLISDNYEISYLPGKLTVNKAALKVSADDKGRNYGEANPALTASYEGLVAGDTPASLSAPVLTTDAVPNSAGGTYAINVAGVSSPNYDITFEAGKLTVGKVALTIKADDVASVYGQAPAFTATADGLVNGDTLGSLGQLMITSDGKGVGVHAIKVSGIVSDRYDVTFVDGTWTINPAPVTVKVNDAMKVYGQDNPAFGVTTTGLLGADVLDGTVAFDTDANAKSPAGTYAVKVSGLASSNYAVTFVDGNLDVAKAALQVKADDKSRAYGAGDPQFTAVFEGLVAGDTPVEVGTPVFRTDANVSSIAGNYAITAAELNAANYDVTYVPGTLTVTKAALSVKADDVVSMYAGARPVFTAKASGLVNGDTMAVLGLLDIHSDGAEVGRHAIKIAPVASDRYEVTMVDGAWDITPAGITVKVNDAMKVYGQENPVFDVTVSGLVGDDKLGGAPVFETDANAKSPAGTYAVKVSGLTSANYTVTFVQGNLAVNKAALQIKADDKARAYGENNPQFTAAYNGLVAGDTADVLGAPVFRTDATVASPAGNYPITVSGVTAANYDVTYVGGNLAVDKARLVVKAEDKTSTYGAAKPQFTAKADGLVNGDTLATLGALNITSDGINAGKHAIKVAPVMSNRYEVIVVDGVWDITPAAATVKVNDATKAYGQNNPAFGLTVTGLVGKDMLNGMPVFETDANATSGAGRYTVKVSGLDSANYVITTVPGTLTVNKAALTVKADDKARVYGAENPVLTASYNGLVAGDTAAALGAPVFETDASTKSTVGTYAIKVSGVGSANYVITTVPGTLTVTKAALTVKAEDKARTYGASNPVFTASFNGLVAGDTAAVLGTPVFETTAIATSVAGNYPITVSGLKTANYDVTYVAGNLAVNKARLVVKADDKSTVYGAAKPLFTATATGLVNNDNLATLGALNITSDGVNAGKHAIKVAPVVSDRYEVTMVDGTWEITPATATVKVNDTTKTYGSDNPVFTVSTTGLVGKDVLTGTPVFSTMATKASGAGNYPVSVGGLSSPNYVVKVADGKLTVTPAGLVVKADDAEKEEGDANPAFTASYTGFVNGDTAASLKGALVFGTTATKSSQAGEYPITVGGVTSPNYAIAFNSGTLNVADEGGCDISGGTNTNAKDANARFGFQCWELSIRFLFSDWKIERVKLSCDTLAPMAAPETIMTRASLFNFLLTGRVSNQAVWQQGAYEGCWKIQIAFNSGKPVASKPFKVQGKTVTANYVPPKR